jgi:hypothetical protein
MKGKLFAVGLNELLDFVRRGHSSLLEPSPLILSFTAPTAAWRFISELHQGSMLARAQSIQETPSFNYCCGSQDARRMIHGSDLYHSTET